jgi:hypothetical protein
MKVKAFIEAARRAEAALAEAKGEPSESVLGDPYDWADDE